jgi:hypothetical protein
MKPAGPARVERRLARRSSRPMLRASRAWSKPTKKALRRLKALCAEVIDPKIAGHRGR